MPKVSFNNSQHPFFSALKEKVNKHFKDENLHTSGNSKLYFKGSIQIVSAIAMYLVLLLTDPGILVSVSLCILLGVNLAVIGFNVMHEGGHQSFSKHTWLNTAGAYFLNVLGGNTFFWKIKHNINHHTYTNIEGMDSDINVKPFMRLHEHQKRYWFHRFQHYYCIVLYGISYFVWVFWDDFEKYFTGRIAEGQKGSLALKEHFIFWISKIMYVLFYILIPVMIVGSAKALIGFAIISFVCGLTIAMVFQLAHVVEGTVFPVPDHTTQKIEKEWAIHQVVTTANFSTKNKVISWLLGGLNFQVEHHLFPRISHIHYPVINKMVKETCIEHQITYLEYASVFQAVGSHFAHIRKLGKAIG